MKLLWKDETKAETCCYDELAIRINKYRKTPKCHKYNNYTGLFIWLSVLILVLLYLITK